jgi:hypothetical protein
VVVAQDQGAELVLARVQAVVHMQAVEVEVKGVAIASPAVLDPAAGPVPAQDMVVIMVNIIMVDILKIR